MAIDPIEAVAAYAEAWTGIDETRRQHLLEQCWADEGVYCDPLNTVAGRDGLTKHIAGFSDRFPGHSIKVTTGADVHDGFARFGWEMSDADGQLVTDGVDFATFAPDGRIARIVGFFGPLPPLDTSRPS